MYIQPQYNPRPPLVQQIYSPYVFQCINCIIEPTDQRGGLYLGDLLATMRTDTLVSHNIGAVLSVAIDGKYEKTNDPRTLHIATKHILAHDVYGYDISQHFDECIQWIQHYLAEKVNVLVHCRAGKSRSASVVIAYMMKTFNMGYENAYAYVKGKRSRTQPNQGFKILLKQYEAKLLAGSHEKLVQKPVMKHSQPLRTSRATKQIIEEVREIREENPTSPASTDKNVMKTGLELRKSVDFAHTSPNISRNSEDVTDRKFMTPQKHSPRERKISSQEKSPGISNYATSEKLSYEHRPIQENKIAFKPVEQVYKPQTQQGLIMEQNQYQQYYPAPLQYHQPSHNQKPTNDKYHQQQYVHQQAPQYMRNNYTPIQQQQYHQHQQYHHHQTSTQQPIQQVQPKPSIQSIQKNLHQNPPSNPNSPQKSDFSQFSPQKESSWTDWFNWFSQ